MPNMMTKKKKKKNYRQSSILCNKTTRMCESKFTPIHTAIASFPLAGTSCTTLLLQTAICPYCVDQHRYNISTKFTNCICAIIGNPPTITFCAPNLACHRGRSKTIRMRTATNLQGKGAPLPSTTCRRIFLNARFYPMTFPITWHLPFNIGSCGFWVAPANMLTLLGPRMNCNANTSARAALFIGSIHHICNRYLPLIMCIFCVYLPRRRPRDNDSSRVGLHLEDFFGRKHASQGNKNL